MQLFVGRSPRGQVEERILPLVLTAVAEVAPADEALPAAVEHAGDLDRRGDDLIAGR